MASTLRFDNWEDSNGTPILDGTNLALPSSALPAGSVLQVVSTTTDTTFSLNSSSFVDVTNMSATITPSATNSKIMVFVNMLTSSDGTSADQARLVRNSTAIAVGSSGDGYWVSNTGSVGTGPGIDMPINYLDSPASTSALTYKIQVRGTGSTFYVNRRGISATPTGVSSITLMEIAG